MFFRRVFSRKEPTANGSYAPHPPNPAPLIMPASPHRNRVRRPSAEEKRSNGLSVVLQLTPLWEHIIRTKSLPANINEAEMFDEFLERLRDPEWQVRQHALRVLVDVLIVMKQRSDQHFPPLIRPLVDNLGHAAPAIRKGALDVLKVYMTETAHAETVLLDIIDIGMEQKLNEAIFGRLCVGVMLSLPSLVQPTLSTSKRHHLLKAAIAALCRKMVQVTYQEVALKVLIRIREMIGAREFSEHIAHADHREFELLCNVYGLPRSESLSAMNGGGGDDDDDAAAATMNNLYISTSAGGNRTWQVFGGAVRNKSPSFNSVKWRNMTERKDAAAADHIHIRPNRRRSAEYSDEKVILETEINIDNTPVTMRILEQNSTTEDSVGHEDDDDDGDVGPVYEHSGIVRVLTDSELEEMNHLTVAAASSFSDDDFVRRTPRRVTFGGEIVKMRTPDSDSVTQSDGGGFENPVETMDNLLMKQSLRIDIPNDNTKPGSVSPRSASASSIQRPNDSPRQKTAAATRRRLSVSPTDEIVSATKPHKQIEVLHNLQRSPLISPVRSSRRNSDVTDEKDINGGTEKEPDEAGESRNVIKEADVVESVQQWEDLAIVSDDVIQNLKSGVSQLRNIFCMFILE